MIIPNNFTEIRIAPNKDSTLKITYYGVIFQDTNGEQLEPAIVTYPRVKINSTELWFDLTKQHIDIEILPDDNEGLETIYIQEVEEENL
jgi:hypothetical protein